MNTSSISPKKTQEDSSTSHKRANTFAYRVGEGIYINLTNRCTNDCTFCLRNNDDRAYDSDVLWLEREPIAREAAEAAEALYFDGCREFVFCGYGEPMCRAEALLETADLLRRAHPESKIRINTNGQSELINKKDVTPLLAGLIDSVSISLNAPDAAAYVRVCRPVFGESAFAALLDFAAKCKRFVPETVFSVVDDGTNGEEIEKCRAIAAKYGVNLRIREYISENNQNK